jgi:hypothetical protein
LLNLVLSDTYSPIRPKPGEVYTFFDSSIQKSPQPAGSYLKYFLPSTSLKFFILLSVAKVSNEKLGVVGGGVDSVPTVAAAGLTVPVTSVLLVVTVAVGSVVPVVVVVVVVPVVRGFLACRLFFI